MVTSIELTLLQAVLFGDLFNCLIFLHALLDQGIDLLDQVDLYFETVAPAIAEPQGEIPLCSRLTSNLDKSSLSATVSGG